MTRQEQIEAERKKRQLERLLDQSNRTGIQPDPRQAPPPKSKEPYSLPTPKFKVARAFKRVFG